MRNPFSIVLDIGKTQRKMTLWAHDGQMLRRETRRNDVIENDRFDALDVEGIAQWVVLTLRDYAAEGEIGAIIPVAHGAGVAAIRDGELVAPPMDYEWTIPATKLERYCAERDAFAETGSPALPDGLNFGAQLFYQEEIAADSFDGATLVPWAQYWSWFLSGEARSEVTSLGCHSDCWSPLKNDFSAIAKRRGWAEKIAPLAKAGEIVGTLRPELANQTGLSRDVKVYCGLHDSNAALVAARGFDQIAGNDATVLSTGTWFVAMRMPKKQFDLGGLREDCDCLVNVDVKGRAIPSGRFMGGREIETLIGIDTRRVDIKPDQPALLAAVKGVVNAGAMVLPTLASGFGPFPNGRGRWVNMPEEWSARRAGACLYAALVADAMLDLIGAKDVLLVEGRFAEAEVFVRALAALRPQMLVYTANAHNDVSFGALRLLNPALKPSGVLTKVEPLPVNLDTYRATWRRRAERAEMRS